MEIMLDYRRENGYHYSYFCHCLAIVGVMRYLRRQLDSYVTVQQMRPMMDTGDKMKRAFIICNCAAFIVCCLFILSPLRLNTDSIRLFAMALPASVGGAYGTDQFPPFYPHLLCGLLKLGWCNSMVLLSINFVALFATLLLLYQIMKLNRCSFVETMLTIASVQMSWCVAKHVLLPQTDVLLLPFFLGCLLAVMYAERAETWKRKSFWLVVSILVAFVAIIIRTAAIPLFAVIAIVATGITPSNFLAIIKKRFFWSVALALFSIFVIGVALAIRFTEFDAEGGYFRMFKRFMSNGGLSDFLTVEWNHLVEIMQLSLNVSASRMPHFAVSPGTVVMSLVCVVALASEWRWVDWCLLLALLGYSLEIFLWPYTDARFLLPVYPIAAMLLVHFALRLWRSYKLIRPVVLCYMLGFSLMGVASWGHLARQWSLGKDFYRHATASILSRDFKNAHTLEIKDIPENERTLTLFILKKVDTLHSFREREELPLHDYKAFTANWHE